MLLLSLKQFVFSCREHRLIFQNFQNLECNESPDQSLETEKDPTGEMIRQCQKALDESNLKEQSVGKFIPSEECRQAYEQLKSNHQAEKNEIKEKFINDMEAILFKDEIDEANIMAKQYLKKSSNEDFQYSPSRPHLYGKLPSEFLIVKDYLPSNTENIQEKQENASRDIFNILPRRLQKDGPNKTYEICYPDGKTFRVAWTPNDLYNPCYGGGKFLKENEDQLPDIAKEPLIFPGSEIREIPGEEQKPLPQKNISVPSETKKQPPVSETSKTIEKLLFKYDTQSSETPEEFNQTVDSIVQELTSEAAKKTRTVETPVAGKSAEKIAAVEPATIQALKQIQIITLQITEATTKKPALSKNIPAEQQKLLNITPLPQAIKTNYAIPDLTARLSDTLQTAKLDADGNLTIEESQKTLTGKIIDLFSNLLDKAASKLEQQIKIARSKKTIETQTQTSSETTKTPSIKIEKKPVETTQKTTISEEELFQSSSLETTISEKKILNEEPTTALIIEQELFIEEEYVEVIKQTINNLSKLKQQILKASI